MDGPDASRVGADARAVRDAPPPMTPSSLAVFLRHDEVCELIHLLDAYHWGVQTPLTDKLERARNRFQKLPLDSPASLPRSIG